ncbi:pyrroline-5-carboxylate reductase [Pararhodobacter zhoushanensis]|uniref:pyrroline-5-carboxylate reductase n=1 Tax=Pararhodobacter zhoushanensis TaxID=2479545 RepID=UPI000F8EC622|nr:pyrroline-5-carboxylate reductase [Pararhodobacter zhoushanensis]
MDMSDIAARGLVLLGCGKMGSALLEGWLKDGLPAASVHVIEPNPSDWLKTTGVALNRPLPAAPAMALLAVKPQMMGAALPSLQALGGGDTVFVSIAAGTSLKAIEDTLGAGTPVVRVMPNTPAAVGRGISALIGNARVSADALDLARQLMAAVGETVMLESESQIDAVTGVSGSGPAYVFHLIEALAAAGVAEGLPEDMAMKLARATVCGAGELAQQSDQSASQLRINVTSPGGTTAAALAVLMNETDGFPALLKRGVKAATDRSRELGQ